MPQAMSAPINKADSLDVLKRLLVPTPSGSLMSQNVLENDPELALPSARTQGEAESNDQLKRMLGLGPSPIIEQQRKDLTARDEAINAANIAATPEVSAQTDRTQRDKIALAGEPNRVSGETSIKLEQAKNESALELERQKQAPLQEFLDRQGQSGATGGEAMQFRPTINESGITLAGIPEPAQTLAQRHSATVGLAQIPGMRQMVDTLEQHGALGPVAGRYSDAVVGKGLDKYLMNPEAARAFADFKTQVKLQKGNMAMTHGGARGGGSPAMMEMFDKMMNTAQTPEALRGALDGFERWLTTYANTDNSAELDAADAAMGITGGPYAATASGYSDPNYQPK